MRANVRAEMDRSSHWLADINCCPCAKARTTDHTCMASSSLGVQPYVQEVSDVSLDCAADNSRRLY